MQTLNDILGSRNAVDIIKVISRLPQGASGREIAAKAGLSPQTALNTLKSLVGLHLVGSRRVGRANLYTLNNKHWFIADGLIPLWKKLDSWLNLLGQFYIEKLPHSPLCIIVYGSYARGEETPESDLDLLFVFDDKIHDESIMDHILSLDSDVFEQFGVSASPKVISNKKFKQSITQSEGLMRNIFREGRSISGITVSEVLSYGSKED